MDRSSDNPTLDPASLGHRLVTEILGPLKRAFVGKDEIVDLMGVALVAGENLFLLGPPGTAKSALVHELGRRLQGRTFEYLLTRFTEPNELFGPFDIRRLREGDLITNTEGMLPEASLVFLDELLNANSAILNSLLMVLNERVFRRGRETRALPTLAVFAASNRLPEDDALGALFDRFLIRVTCDNVPPDRLTDVLHAGWKLDQSARDGDVTNDDALTTSTLTPTPGLRYAEDPDSSREDPGLRSTSDPASGATKSRLSADDVRQLNRALVTVDLTAIATPLANLVQRLRNAGLPFSDRRAVKMQRLVAASTLLSGRDRALLSDLWVFRHVWDTLEQQEVLNALVQETLKDSPPNPQDHPRAAGSVPNAEDLARDLDDLHKRLDDAQTPPAERATLKDRLGLLAGRVQWVADDQQRAFLQQRVDALWSIAGGAAGGNGGAT